MNQTSENLIHDRCLTQAEIVALDKTAVRVPLSSTRNMMRAIAEIEIRYNGVYRCKWNGQYTIVYKD